MAGVRRVKPSLSSEMSELSPVVFGWMWLVVWGILTFSWKGIVV